MSEPEILHAETTEGGRYSVRIDGVEAYLTYVRPRDGVIRIEHTIVPDALGGRGLGKKLVTRAVEDAIARGDMLESTCWFASALVDKKPEWKARSA